MTSGKVFDLLYPVSRHHLRLTCKTEAATQARHPAIVRIMMACAGLLDPLPHLFQLPVMDRQPLVHVAPTVSLNRGDKRWLFGSLRALLRAQTHTIQNPYRLPRFRIPFFAAELGHDLLDLIPLVVTRAVPVLRVRPHPARLDLLQKVPAGPAHELEPESIMLRMLLGQFPDSLPFDFAQIRMHHDHAIPDAGLVGQLDNHVEHRLGILSGG